MSDEAPWPDPATTPVEIKAAPPSQCCELLVSHARRSPFAYTRVGGRQRDRVLAQLPHALDDDLEARWWPTGDDAAVVAVWRARGGHDPGWFHLDGDVVLKGEPYRRSDDPRSVVTPAR